MTDSIADQVLAARRERIRRGVAQCRAVLAEVETERGLDRAAGQVPLSEAEVRHARAVERAAREKRAQRMAGTE